MLAERRGDLVTSLYRTDQPNLSAACLARHPAGTDDVAGVRFGVAGSNGPAAGPPPAGSTQGGVLQYDRGGA